MYVLILDLFIRILVSWVAAPGSFHHTKLARQVHWGVLDPQALGGPGRVCAQLPNRFPGPRRGLGSYGTETAYNLDEPRLWRLERAAGPRPVWGFLRRAQQRQPPPTLGRPVIRVFVDSARGERNGAATPSTGSGPRGNLGDSL